MKSPLRACILGSWLILAGCATSTQLGIQSLEPTDPDLSGIQQNLVILSVVVLGGESGSYYRLEDVWATNTTTATSYRFPLFDNFIMRSKDAPHVLEGDRLRETVILDLPAGTYTLDKLELVTLEDHIDDTVDDYYVHQPFPKPTFEVGPGAPKHLGELTLRILALEQVGSEFRADLRLIPRRAGPADIRAIQDAYPALAGVEIRSDSLRTR